MNAEFADAINDAINGTINLGFGIYDRIYQNNTDQVNRELQEKFFNQQYALANEQFDWNKKVAENNFNLQQQQFNYQKQLNQLQMDREDTAYQRAVTDLKNAGLSPLALTGGSQAQPLNAGTAPQMDVNGVNTAYGAKQDYYNRKREQANFERQMEFNQRQQHYNMILQNARLMQDVRSARYDNRIKAEEIRTKKFENDWYNEHGYRPHDVALVLSDFLKSDGMQKFLKSASELGETFAKGFADAIDKLVNILDPEVEPLDRDEIYSKLSKHEIDALESFEKETGVDITQLQPDELIRFADEFQKVLDDDPDSPFSEVSLKEKIKRSWHKLKSKFKR